MSASTPADLVGAIEIATRCGVARDTVEKWRARKVKSRPPFPPPRWPQISGGPVWDWNLDVVPWLKVTGRVDATV